MCALDPSVNFEGADVSRKTVLQKPIYVQGKRSQDRLQGLQRPLLPETLSAFWFSNTSLFAYDITPGKTISRKEKAERLWISPALGIEALRKWGSEKGQKNPWKRGNYFLGQVCQRP